MTLNTASAIISLAKKFENDSAEFYEALSQRYAKDADVFLSFAKENRKNVVEIERTYYGVITDAIECCFAFDLSPDDYTFQAESAEKTSYSDDLAKAIEIEEKMMKFYSDAAEQSNSLMADVPRAFRMVAKKRSSRGSKLRSLLDKEG